MAKVMSGMPSRHVAEEIVLYTIQFLWPRVNTALLWPSFHWKRQKFHLLPFTAHTNVCCK